MVLTGGTSALKGLSETLQNRFNVSVEVYDPLKTYEFEGDGIYGPQFAVAIGLARRGD
jgi:Tfp pilus assembly PilM family ATPase